MIDFRKIDAAIEAAPPGEKARAAVKAMIPAFEVGRDGSGPNANSFDACSEDCPWFYWHCGNEEQCRLKGMSLPGRPGPDCPARR